MSGGLTNHPAPQGYQQQQEPMGVPADEAANYARQAAKAQSSRVTGTCPECNSGNYFHPPGSGANFVRCMDCGYNPNFMQQGGIGGGKADGPVNHARQTWAGGAGGGARYDYSPEAMIAHIK
jgi:hypothetical protein